MKFLFNTADITNGVNAAIDTALVLSLNVGTNTLEVQNDKPISKLYFSASSAHGGALAVQYWNGTSYAAVSSLNDLTNSLKSDGWVEWVNPTDLAKDGDYYKFLFVLSGVTASVNETFRFIGIVFAEDKDLKKEYPNISDYLPAGDTSFIRFHASTADAIVQFFRAKGKATRPQGSSRLYQLDAFDFLDTNEMRQAGKFIALSKIFHWLSDSVDDKWYQKGRDFLAQGNSSLEVYYLSIDTDRDASPDESEVMQTNELRIVRA